MTRRRTATAKRFAGPHSPSVAGRRQRSLLTAVVDSNLRHVPSTGGAALLGSRHPPARLTAVAFAVVAAPAQEEPLTASPAPDRPHPQHTSLPADRLRLDTEGAPWDGSNSIRVPADRRRLGAHTPGLHLVAAGRTPPSIAPGAQARTSRTRSARCRLPGPGADRPAPQRENRGRNHRQRDHRHSAARTEPPSRSISRPQAPIAVTHAVTGDHRQ
jgi:hypothetical protein